MNRYSILFFIAMPLFACTTVGHRYVNSRDTDEEYIMLNPDTTITKWGLAAAVIDTSLEVTIFLKLVDTQKYEATSKVESIRFNVNNLSSDQAKKSIRFIDAPQTIMYTNLADVAGLAERIKSGLPIEFMFEFDEKNLVDQKHILLHIDIDAQMNGQPQFLTKAISLTRKDVGRSWFLAH